MRRFKVTVYQTHFTCFTIPNKYFHFRLTPSSFWARRSYFTDTIFELEVWKTGKSNYSGDSSIIGELL